MQEVPFCEARHRTCSKSTQMPESLVRKWFQINSSNICYLVLHWGLTKPMTTPVSYFYRTHGTKAPHNLYVRCPLMYGTNAQEALFFFSHRQENSHEWDFEGKKCLWDAVKLKTNKTTPKTPHTCLGSLETSLSLALGQGALCANVSFCKVAKSKFPALLWWKMLSSALRGCGLAVKPENMHM